MSYWLSQVSTSARVYSSVIENPLLNVYLYPKNIQRTAFPDCLRFNTATINAHRPSIPFYDHPDLRGIHRMKFFVEVTARAHSDDVDFTPATEGKVLHMARELLEELPQRCGVICVVTDSVRYKFYRVTNRFGDLHYEMSSIFLRFKGFAVRFPNDWLLFASM